VLRGARRWSAAAGDVNVSACVCVCWIIFYAPRPCCRARRPRGVVLMRCYLAFQSGTAAKAIYAPSGLIEFIFLCLSAYVRLYIFLKGPRTPLLCA
jgi:hypothetical protein